MSQKLFKILTPNLWHGREQSVPTMPIDRADGYIHLSTEAQRDETLALHFRGAGNVVVLEIDADLISDGITWEEARGGQLFPHVYGDIPLDAVSAARRAYVNREGMVTYLWQID